MKEFIKATGIIVGGIIGLGLAFYMLFGFANWLFNDPFHWMDNNQGQIVQEKEPTYVWNQCFDNDYPTFTQEYVDKVAKEVEEKHQGNSCYWRVRGNGDVMGCTGDLYYSYICY